MSETSIPVLYSYRRCPYAMRGRLALGFSGIDFEVREISFKDKPKQMLDVSPKGTVPVLVLESGQVIDESLDVVLHAVSENKSGFFSDLNAQQHELGKSLYDELQTQFIGNLNRYKYPDRFPNDEEVQKNGPIYYRDLCEAFVKKLDGILAENSFLLGTDLSQYDILLFPLIRQFRVADKDWFDDNLECPHVKKWINWFFDHEVYKKIMEKFTVWDHQNPGKPTGEPTVIQF